MLRRMTALAALVLAVGFLPACAGNGVAQQGSGSAMLANGTYDVDVTLQGGSGRASVASPAVLTVEDGGLTATITWSSSHYDLMVVGGADYRPVNTEGNSQFTIPVPALDADMAVQAETTAMSKPHLINYTLRFSNPREPGTEVYAGTGTEATGPTTQTVADFHDSDLGCGMEPTSSLPLDYAECFTVDYYDDGYKLLCLADGERYLVVPEGASEPEGLADGIVVLRQPVCDIYLAASDTMCLIDALDQLDRVTVSGIAQEDWSVDAAVAAMQTGAIAYGGKYSAPDYDLLLSKGVGLAIESTMINHAPEVKEKLTELGIPVLTEMSSYESDPLGRAEWIKLYGALFDQEDRAEWIFEQQVARAKTAMGQVTGKTVAYFYINSNGSAVVRRPGDYVTRMIEDAGGSYIFRGLGDDAARSTVTLEMEQFYAQAKDADVIIYNGAIDGGVNSLAELEEKNPLLADFKAVREGNVWCTNQDMYQQMLRTGDIIADLHAALADPAADELTFLHRLG